MISGKTLITLVQVHFQKFRKLGLCPHTIHHSKYYNYESDSHHVESEACRVKTGQPYKLGNIFLQKFKIFTILLKTSPTKKNLIPFFPKYFLTLIFFFFYLLI